MFPCHSDLPAFSLYSPGAAGLLKLATVEVRELWHVGLKVHDISQRGTPTHVTHKDLSIDRSWNVSASTSWISLWFISLRKTEAEVRETLYSGHCSSATLSAFLTA